MQNNSQFIDIFKRGSTTYFYSSLFFPPDVKNDVRILYAFVRTADNYVDNIPQDKKGFASFVQEYSAALKGKKINNPVIYEYARLAQRKQFDTEWTRAFLQSMEQDLRKKVYRTLGETEAYVYGSAEVIGLMMAAILNLPEESYPAARMLGKAMQYINFIRDIQEDIELGRTYLPADELQSSGLKMLNVQEAVKKPHQFSGFIRQQITHYENWQQQAEKGFHLIPRRYRSAIKTASDMYKYTASRIYRDPFIVFEKKVKPAKSRILLTGLKNCII